MKIAINKNGSFSVSGEKIRILNAYPEINGVALRPVSVQAEKEKIEYTLEDGKLTLNIRSDGEKSVISCAIDGIDDVHDISPLGAGVIESCDRVFVQGFGIAGPSGFSKLDQSEKTSHSLIAVGNDEACLVLYAADQKKYHNYYRINGKKISALFDTELIKTDALPEIYIIEGADFSGTLKSAAKTIAGTMGARKVTNPAFHWCSWYYLYHNLDQQILEDYLKGFNEFRDIAPYSHIQIDAGYFPSCGDWLINTPRFPKGLEYAAKTITDAGYEPGIWIGPFMVGDNSELYKKHPDWILYYNDGTPVRPWIQYNEPKPWGYIDSDYFVLDTSNPEAMTYLKNVFVTLKKWGYTLFKTDFLLWGIQDSSKVRRYTPGKTSFEYFRDVMAMIRESIGDDARWLGCIAPFMPSIGFVDMMRIAGDVGAQWEEDGFGPANMLREVTADQYFNNIYWQNDPDAVMLRDFHIHLTEEQIQALAILAAMSGTTIYTSDPVHLMGESRRKLLDFIRPDGLRAPEYPFWQDMKDEVCIVNKLKTRTNIYFFNATDKELVIPADWEKLAGNDAKNILSYSGEKYSLPYIKLPPRSGRLYFASNAPMDNIPRNIWAE